jgi:nanoRNase/pAp phosphatase (c-di-AMP/oligoRNAs hydrolase)
MAAPTRTREKLEKLKTLWADRNSLLIVMQDNPDPDAIAASCALKELANKTADINCQLAYGGTIGRAENRELVHYLGFNFHPFGEIAHKKFDLTALIDTQPATGNNPLPADSSPDIVIDHHPIRKATRSVAFIDVRKHYGATSTILWEYLSSAKITPEIPIATALLYGIRSDTQDLGRESTKADIDAMEALYPLANKRMLSQIQRGRVPSAYYQMLTTALANTRIYGHCSICNIGDIDNPDMIGEVADILLRHEQLDWVLCFGFYKHRLLISIRTQDKDLSAEGVIRDIVHRIGTGGGHPTMAGGQIPLNLGKKTASLRSRLERLVCHRFLNALKIKNKKGRPLIRTPVKTDSKK